MSREEAERQYKEREKMFTVKRSSKVIKTFKESSWAMKNWSSRTTRQRGENDEAENDEAENDVHGEPVFEGIEAPQASS